MVFVFQRYKKIIVRNCFVFYFLFPSFFSDYIPSSKVSLIELSDFLNFLSSFYFNITHFRLSKGELWCLK